MFNTLVSTTTLGSHLNDPDWIIFDGRFVVGEPERGYQKYLADHIPGARYVSLDADMSSPPTEESGRHPLPDPEVFSKKLREWGVNSDSQVIIYDDATGALAARMWWLLRWLGHDAVALLDGGFDQWLREEGEVQVGTLDTVEKGDFEPVVHNDMWVSLAQLETLLGHKDVAVLDARSSSRYSGEQESVDPEGGHIPTSINHPLTDNLDKKNCFLPPDKLRKMFQSLNQPTTIHSCGSGVTACHNLLAMEIAGFAPTKLYVGSWSEWIQSPDRIRMKGMEPGDYPATG